MEARSPHAAQGFELRGQTTPVGRLLAEAWRARSLVRMLARRDFYTRYRRPTFGVIWSIVVPLLQAIVLSIVFTKVVRIRTPGVPYIVFVLSGTVPWTFFSSALGSGVRSITSGSNMASKVYFPRSVLPLATIGTGFYGFIPSLVVLIAIAVVRGVPIGLHNLMVIPGTLLMLAVTASFVLVLAALQVYFRDVAYVVIAVLQAWFYASTVIFPITLVPQGWLRAIVIINPATGMVEAFRAAFQGFDPYTLLSMAFAAGWVVVLSIAAVLLYRRYDRVFVDLL